MLHSCDLAFSVSASINSRRFNLVRILCNFLETISHPVLTLVDLHTHVIFWITHELLLLRLLLWG